MDDESRARIHPLIDTSLSLSATYLFDSSASAGASSTVKEAEALVVEGGVWPKSAQSLPRSGMGGGVRSYRSTVMAYGAMYEECKRDEEVYGCRTLTSKS